MRLFLAKAVAIWVKRSILEWLLVIGYRLLKQVIGLLVRRLIVIQFDEAELDFILPHLGPVDPVMMGHIDSFPDGTIRRDAATATCYKTEKQDECDYSFHGRFRVLFLTQRWLPITKLIFVS